MRFIYTYGNIAVDTIEEALELRQKFGSDYELERVEADPLVGIGMHAYMGSMGKADKPRGYAALDGER